MRWVVGPRQRQGGVVFDRALVREPQQRAAVVAERVGNLAPRRLGPDCDRPHPFRGVLRHVLLHERRLARPHPDHRQRPSGQHRKDAVVDRVQIVDEFALGRLLVAADEWLIEVGQLDAGPRFHLSLTTHWRSLVNDMLRTVTRTATLTTGRTTRRRWGIPGRDRRSGGDLPPAMRGTDPAGEIRSHAVGRHQLAVNAAGHRVPVYIAGAELDLELIGGRVETDRRQAAGGDRRATHNSLLRLTVWPIKCDTPCKATLFPGALVNEGRICRQGPRRSGCGTARTSSSGIPLKSSGLQGYSGSAAAIVVAAISAS